MKRIVRHIAGIFLMLLYVYAQMGFGIHCCHEEGARYFVPLLGDVSAEAVHSFHHDHHHDCPHHGTDRCRGCHGCDSFSSEEEPCTMDVFVVNDAQDSDNGCGKVFSCCSPAVPVLQQPAFSYRTVMETGTVVLSPPGTRSGPARLSIWRL